MLLTYLFNHITLEPLVVLLQFGYGLVEGGQIQSDLLIWKICHLEFNYPEDICSNLTLDKYDSINDRVQTKANNMLGNMQYMISGPALVWSFFAGALLDKFGPKLFIILPLLGRFFSDIGCLVNFAFIEKLPLEFFYVEACFGLFGGMSMYYMGKQ